MAMQSSLQPNCVTIYDNIQMMHGSEWTLKCDEPEVENVIIFNVARTTVLHMFCRMANH